MEYELTETAESDLLSHLPLKQFVGRTGKYGEFAGAYNLVSFWIRSGLLQLTLIELGEVPSGDKDREANATKLNKLLPPFRGYVDPAQRTSPDGDGILFWDSLQNQEQGEAILEIGDTKARATLQHLRFSWKNLARWMYGSTEIYLLTRTCPIGGLYTNENDLLEIWRGHRGEDLKRWFRERYESPLPCKQWDT